MQLPNLLNMALTLIGTQTYEWYRFLERTPNAIGNDVTTYYPPALIQAQVQPVPHNLFQQYGLDFQKQYVTFYLSKDVADIDRDVSGDQFVFNCERYQALSTNNWAAINGWVGVMAVKI